MRFDNVDSADVVRFICGGSSCNEIVVCGVFLGRAMT